MPITFQTDMSRELTVFKITGTVKIPEWLKTLQEYAKDGVTRLELYDIRDGEGEGFTSKQIDQIIEQAKSSTSPRPPGSKTALVVSKDVHFGMSRVYQAVSEIEGITWKTETFRSMEEAYKWLGIDISEAISK
jgi:hypothetical protein